jgi:hypothetical protein
MCYFFKLQYEQTFLFAIVTSKYLNSEIFKKYLLAIVRVYYASVGDFGFISCSHTHPNHESVLLLVCETMLLSAVLMYMPAQAYTNVIDIIYRMNNQYGSNYFKM